MKNVTPFTLIFACLLQLHAFSQDTTYYDAGWKETTPANASFFRTKVKNAGIWVVEDRFQSGKMEMTGSYEDDSFHIMHGEFKWYEKNGKLHHQCTYAHGTPDGNDVFYYDNGRKKLEGTYKNGKRDGEWTGYYKSGKPSGKAQFADDRQVSASFFHEDGTVDKSMKLFIKDPSYRGGQPQLQRFLAKNIQYPEKAIKNNIQGTVIVAFKVTPEGRVGEIKVLQSVDKLLDNEAIRVIRMTEWEPAIYGRIASESYFKLPVVFRF